MKTQAQSAPQLVRLGSIFVLLSSVTAPPSSASNETWTVLSRSNAEEVELELGDDLRIRASHEYCFFRLQVPRLAAELEAAAASPQGARVSYPLPDGTIRRVRAVEDSRFSAEHRAAYPNWKYFQADAPAGMNGHLAFAGRFDWIDQVFRAYAKYIQSSGSDVELLAVHPVGDGSTYLSLLRAPDFRTARRERCQ
jgi:hypothetical protein